MGRLARPDKPCDSWPAVGKISLARSSKIIMRHGQYPTATLDDEHVYLFTTCLIYNAYPLVAVLLRLGPLSADPAVDEIQN